MTGSFMGRRNQYIQLVKVLYWKLLTNSKQLPAFQLEVGLISEVGGKSITTLPPRPLQLDLIHMYVLEYIPGVTVAEW